MKNIRHEIALWVQAATIIGLWLGLVYFSDHQPGITSEALGHIPDVVFIYGCLYLLFTKWLWRKKVFGGWLVPFPDLEGTWKGTLTSTWIDPSTGRSPGPIPVVLSIRQTFATLSCVLYTRESHSMSIAASFQIDDESDQKSISYVYTNTPRVSVRDRSSVHDGATILLLSTSPQMRLQGEYWTNRKSTGEMDVVRASSKVADSFEE